MNGRNAQRPSNPVRLKPDTTYASAKMRMGSVACQPKLFARGVAAHLRWLVRRPSTARLGSLCVFHGCLPAAALAHLREKSREAAEAVRAFTDAQLDTAAPFSLSYRCTDDGAVRARRSRRAARVASPGQDPVGARAAEIRRRYQSSQTRTSRGGWAWQDPISLERRDPRRRSPGRDPGLGQERRPFRARELAQLVADRSRYRHRGVGLVLAHAGDPRSHRVELVERGAHVPFAGRERSGGRFDDVLQLVRDGRDSFFRASGCSSPAPRRTGVSGEPADQCSNAPCVSCGSLTAVAT